MKKILAFFIASSAVLIGSFSLLQAVEMEQNNAVVSHFFIGIAVASLIWFIHTLIFKNNDV